MSKVKIRFCSDRCKSLLLLLNILIIAAILTWNQHANRRIISSQINENKYPSNPNQSLNSSCTRLPIPALIVAGPPKTGTNAFRETFNLYPDAFAYPIEHFFWGSYSRKKIKCEPLLNASEWNDYLNAYSSNKTTLSALIPIVYASNHQSNEHCNAKAFETTYQQFMNNTKCQNQCLFFEKAPAYARRPMVPIFVANLLPKTKYLTILRNPITHIWSNYFHFGGAKTYKNDSKGREEGVIKLFNNVSSVHYLNGIMVEILIRYQALNHLNKGERHKMMKVHYMRLIVEYLRRKYISPKDVEPMNDQKGSKVVWATYYLPVLLIGMFANNEVHQTSNYKWIQFEWLWHYPLDSMRTIKCWITGDDKECGIKRDYPQNIELFSIVNRTNHKATAAFTDYYIQEIKALFIPHTNLLTKALLRDRSDLLIGQWKKWKYFD